MTDNNKKDNSEKSDEAYVVEESEAYVFAKEDDDVKESDIEKTDTDIYSESWSTGESDGNDFIKDDDMAGSVSEEDDISENEEYVSKEDDTTENEEQVTAEDDITVDEEPVLKENTSDEAV